MTTSSEHFLLYTVAHIVYAQCGYDCSSNGKELTEEQKQLRCQGLFDEFLQNMDVNEAMLTAQELATPGGLIAIDTPALDPSCHGPLLPLICVWATWSRIVHSGLMMPSGAQKSCSKALGAAPI